MFFDDYPAFLETSDTAASASRLGWWHRFIIEDNADLLVGKRVLDLASHDGRWSFAALKAGASHVTGVEFRPEMVASARATFDGYRVDPSTYRFIAGDLFELLRDPGQGIEVDVVLCLGFLYHTLRYAELLNGWRASGPSTSCSTPRSSRATEPGCSSISSTPRSSRPPGTPAGSTRSRA